MEEIKKFPSGIHYPREYGRNKKYPSGIHYPIGYGRDQNITLRYTLDERVSNRF